VEAVLFASVEERLVRCLAGLECGFDRKLRAADPAVVAREIEQEWRLQLGLVERRLQGNAGVVLDKTFCAECRSWRYIYVVSGAEQIASALLHCKHKNSDQPWGISQ
jgi:hypothetical protein